MKTVQPVLLATLLFVQAPAMSAESTYNGWSLRDPFTDSKTESSAPTAPVVNADSIGQSLQVTGISYSETNPKAIVNGKVLSVGDPVGKLGKLSRIERDGIAVTIANKEYFFRQTLGKKTNDTPSAKKA